MLKNRQYTQTLFKPHYSVSFFQANRSTLGLQAQQVVYLEVRINQAKVFKQMWIQCLAANVTKRFKIGFCCPVKFKFKRGDLRSPKWVRNPQATAPRSDVLFDWLCQMIMIVLCSALVDQTRPNLSFLNQESRLQLHVG